MNSALLSAQKNCVNGIIVQYFESNESVTVKELRENVFSVYYKDLTDLEIKNIIKSVSKFYNYKKMTVVKNNKIYDKIGNIQDLLEEIEKDNDSVFVFEGLEYNTDEISELLFSLNKN